MARNFYTLITNIGKAKIANAQVLGEKVDITQVAVGDGQQNPTEDQTALHGEKWRGPIGSISIDDNNPNWIVLEAIVPPNIGGFTIREIGAFDSDGDLIAVGKMAETYKPVFDEGTSKDLSLNMIIAVENADVVQIRVDPSVVIASRKYVDEKVAPVEQKANQNQQNIATLNQTVTAHLADYANHLNDNTPHREATTMERSGQDSEGVFTVLEYKRADGTLFKKSELSGGTSPEYTTRTVEFYDTDGTTIVQTVVYNLTYDGDGNLVSEVIQL